MALDEIYSLTTKEGHHYKIGFSTFNLLHLPENLKKEVADVVIAVKDNKGINNANTLFQFAKIIKDYLHKRDVILYCYCDNKEIERAKAHHYLAPQEYRSILFQKMFDRASNKDFISRPITLIDGNNEIHCIHLISRIENSKDIDILSFEIFKLQK